MVNKLSETKIEQLMGQVADQLAELKTNRHQITAQAQDLGCLEEIVQECTQTKLGYERVLTKLVDMEETKAATV